MENTEKDDKIDKKIESRKNKIIAWFKNPYNLFLFVLLVLFIALRIYWLFKTYQQPLWFDEADYLNMAKSWGGFTYWNYYMNTFNADITRPVLFSLVSAFFYLIGLGETTLRIIMLLCSIASVVVLYYIGKLFFNKETALISAFLLAIFWSFSFYTYRMLADVPVTLLVLLTIFVFFDAYFNNRGYKNFILAGIFLALAFLTKFPAVFLVLAIAVYLLITEKFKIFKNTKIIVFYLASLITVIPFFIYEYLRYGSPLAFLFVVIETRALPHTLLASMWEQGFFTIQIMHWPLILLFVIGFALCLIYMLISFEKIPSKNSLSNKYLFIFLWILVALLIFGKLDWDNYMEERYYFVFYPAIFLLAGEASTYIFNFLKKYSKILAALVILTILAFGAYTNISHADQIINVKINSYVQAKEAGLWVKVNTNSNDKILLVYDEIPLVAYYSERDFRILNITKAGVVDEINKYHPKYLVESLFMHLPEPKDNESTNYVFNNPSIFQPVQMYGPYLDQQQTIPSVVIFQINSAVSNTNENSTIK